MNLTNIILVGFMGSGKSAVGREIANRYKLEFFDTDSFIEQEESLTISSIFKDYGESYFRFLENQLCQQMPTYKDCVISTGGGMMENRFNREYAKRSGVVFYLFSTPEVVFERIKHNFSDRPLLNNEMKIKGISDIMKKRHDNYKDSSDCVVLTDNFKVEEVATQIWEKFCEKIK